MLRTLILIATTLCFIVLARYTESATKSKPRSNTEFSAENVMDYLKVIAAETHPIGSTANKKVKDYLVEELNKLGLETRVESGYQDMSWGQSSCRTSFIENIIAILPGTDPNGQKVVLSAHYDSVFEGPGAADDGYAVASMLETVKLLKAHPRKNDIKLIITDGEEMGLFGARYHVQNNAMDDVGILLNYEARGNEGPAIFFEWSEDNAWMVREMKKSAIRPITSSLSFEVYKIMRNSSDFTAFAQKKVPGINNAFIDGFSYYHNPADNVENISMNSIQHAGENMYLMARHFANYDFSIKESGNASFFNFYGRLIHYPASLNLYLLILLGLFFVGIQVLARKREGFKVLRIAKYVLGLLATILIVGLGNFGLAELIKQMYPQYATFYAFHYYNHEWYFLAGLGLSFMVLAIASRCLIPVSGRVVQGNALFILMSLLSIALYLAMPTGSYIMMLPTLGLGLIIILQILTKTEEKEGWLAPMGYLFFLVGMWTFISHNLFLAFSLGALPGAVLLATITGLASMYLLPSAWHNKGRKLILGLGLLLFVGSLLIAHLKSTPSKKEPLLTNLKYVYDTENEKTYVATFDDYIHEGHLNLLDDAEEKRLPNHLTYSRYYKEKNLDLSMLKSTVYSDTTSLYNGKTYVIKNPKRASIAYLYLPEAANIDSVFLDNRFHQDISAANNNPKRLTLFGYGLDSLHLRVTKLDTSLPATIYINMEYPELGEALTAKEGTAWNDPITFISHKVIMEKY